MKKILTALLLFSSALAFSQVSPVYVALKSAGQHRISPYKYWTWASLGYDTISNLDTTSGATSVGAMHLPGGSAKSNLVVDSIKLNGSYTSGSIQCTFKKVAGTPVDTAVLQVSDDGITWVPSGQDTMLISNVSYTQIHIWSLPGRPITNTGTQAALNTSYLDNLSSRNLQFLYYRVYMRGLQATTSSGIVKCWFVGRQY